MLLTGGKVYEQEGAVKPGAWEPSSRTASTVKLSACWMPWRFARTLEALVLFVTWSATLELSATFA
jgi:hypothetical protein